MEYMDLVRKAAGYITSKIEKVPETAVVLGSGLGFFADLITEKCEIPYQEIPGFPVSTAPGHAGKLICGYIGKKYVLCMSGRFHFYEGYAMRDVSFYVRALKVLGIKKLIITNATGGINKCFTPGDLMIIKDHIKFFDDSPLRGENISELGPRFNDMSEVYDKGLIEIAKSVAKKQGIDIKEGVYAFMPGPSYETPAEIKALGILGADAVGMSTVPEVITAAHCGLKVLGISCITNLAAGITKHKLTEEEVFETANKVGEKFSALVAGITAEI